MTTPIDYVELNLIEALEKTEVCKRQLDKMFPKQKELDIVGTTLAIMADSAIDNLNETIKTLTFAIRQVQNVKDNSNLS